MLIQPWSQVFLLSLEGLWYGFIAIFPKIIIALIIFIVGWIIASTLGSLVTAGVDALKLDRLFKGPNTDAALARAGIHLHIGKVFGELVKWFIIVFFLIASLNILGLDQVTLFLQEVLSYIPQVIIAVLILVAGTIVADFARKFVSASAAVANIRSSRMLGTITWILALVTALDKLGIFGYFGQTLLTGFVVMFALAFGLAFGLGGRDAAGRFIDRISDDLSSRNPQ
jgi:hypothetical protein